jgi:hypothetical protein
MGMTDMIFAVEGERYKKYGIDSEILKNAWIRYWTKFVTDKTYTLDGKPLTVEELKTYIGYPKPFLGSQKCKFYCDKSLFEGDSKHYSFPVPLKSTRKKDHKIFDPFFEYFTVYHWGGRIVDKEDVEQGKITKENITQFPTHSQIMGNPL